MDQAVTEVMTAANFISGNQVKELEQELAEYVGVKHCVTCGSGTDALTLALKALNIGAREMRFLFRIFTFFASGETPALEGATPVFVDVEKETFNLSAESLRQAVEKVKEEGKLVPKARDRSGSVRPFRQIIRKSARSPISMGMYLIEDGAQGFGGKNRREKSVQFRGHFRYFFSFRLSLWDAMETAEPSLRITMNGLPLCVRCVFTEKVVINMTT